MGADDKEAVLFPALGKLGVENQGLSNCKGKDAVKCRPVQQLTLDSLDIDLFIPSEFSNKQQP
jgi:hypothetical protein